MELHPVLGVVLATIFVVANGFFVLAEFAIVKVRASRVNELVASGHPLAPVLAKRILPQLDEFLSVTQIGITIASLALGWIGEPATAAIIHEVLALFGAEEVQLPEGLSFAIGFMIVTVAHVVLGELIPKTIAIQKADTMALWCARPLQFFYGMFYPLLVSLNWMANGILSLFGMRSGAEHEVSHSPQELRILLAGAKERGILDPQIFAMIDNAFGFRARTVREIMVPRERAVFLSLSRSWRENREFVRRFRHTRYPLCEGDLDSTMGLVHLKDITLRTISSSREVDVRKFRRDIFELPPDTRLDRALGFLRARSAHLALVRHPGKPVEGIVCLEDIVELIVGKLEDEFDREERTSLAEILDPRLIDLAAEAPDKVALFRRGVELLRAWKPELDPESVLAAIAHREDVFSTGIGGGVAIPHAILEDLDKPAVAILRIKRGVDYQSIDLKPVRLVFLFLLPATNPGLRLRFFSELGGLLQKPGFQDRLMAATDAGKLAEILRAALSSPAAKI